MAGNNKIPTIFHLSRVSQYSDNTYELHYMIFTIKFLEKFVFYMYYINPNLSQYTDNINTFKYGKKLLFKLC
jgi:hypothetical protein